MTEVGGIAVDRLRSLIERIERLEEEKKAIAGDIRDIFAEAKSAGFDVKVMREILKLRKMDAADRDEKELLLEVMDEIYETFVISCVLAGVIPAPSFWENKEKYLAHSWTAAPKKWIDPSKEATANKIALNTGQKTFQQMAAENGMDWKEQMDEILEVLEYARERGLEMGGVMFGKDGLFNPDGKGE